ncbi:MAG: phosphate ABC transporter ATP-binding protein PstB [Pseudanabaenaceae cyanobacterium]
MLSNESVALQLRNVSVYYGKQLAIHDVSMDIYKNMVTAFIGPSGCGKSTLIRCFNRMNDLIEGVRIEGEILLHGEDIYNLNPIELRRRVGMVFQRPNPFPKSIYENIALGLRINGFRGSRLDMDEVVKTSLEQVGLWDEVKNRLRDNALNLSGGQQQRLCIARVVALQPEIMVMDEPCSSLDPISSLLIDELLVELKKRYAVVIITHNLQQAARVADRVAFIAVEQDEKGRYGKLREYAPVTHIFISPDDELTQNYVNTRIG